MSIQELNSYLEQFYDYDEMARELFEPKEDDGVIPSGSLTEGAFLVL